MPKTHRSIAAPVAETLARLSTAAAEVRGGWTPSRWTETRGTRERTLHMRPKDHHFDRYGVFDEFDLPADEGMDLVTRLRLPSTVSGVPVTDQPLELTVISLRPIEIYVDDRRVFGDALPVVANGPALITLLDRIAAGDNGALRLRVLPSPVPLQGDWASSFMVVRLTTPGLRERFSVLDLAHARLLLAARLAERPEERERVLYAAESVPEDLSSLTTGELRQLLGGVDGACGMAAELALLRRVSERFRVHCVGHSHIDLAWLWTYDDAREVLLRDMRSVVGLFEDYPNFRFTHSQAAGYAEIQKTSPDLFEKAHALVTAGRLEPASVQWVEADANLPSGPAHARQLMEGVGYTRRHLGREPTVLLAPDTFGHTGNMPQLARQAGARVYYHHRANPGFRADTKRWPAYWWEGDDGSRVLAISTPVYLGPVTATRLAHDLLELGAANGLKDVCFFYGVGDHGGGPTRQDLDAIALLDQAAGFPAVTCATVQDYADALLSSSPDLPVSHGESATVFEGCYVTHADAKRMNRDAENALVSAESLAAMAGLNAAERLSEAWRKLLFHQFHDILGGSAVAAAYDHQLRDYEAVRQIAADVTTAALEVLGSAPAGALNVTNPLGFDRRAATMVSPQTLREHGGSIDFEDPRKSLVAVDGGGVPAPMQRTRTGDYVFVTEPAAFETRPFRFEQANAAPDGVRVSTGRVRSNMPDEFLVVDTDHLVAHVRRDCGVITHLFDKRSGHAVMGQPDLAPESMRQLRPELALGVLHVLREHPHPMSSWVIDDVYSERALIRGARTEVVENGPVRAVFSTVHHVRDTKIETRLVFYANLPQIEIEIETDWAEVGCPQDGIPGLSLSFGTGCHGDIWYETPFSAAKRPADGHVRPALRWIAAERRGGDGGVAILNDGKHGFEALGHRLRAYLLRGAYDPDPRSDAGRRDCARFAVLPFTGDWRTAGIVQAAASLNQPLVVHRSHLAHERRADQARPHLERAGTAVIAGLIPAEDGGFLIRLYESGGRSCSPTLSGLPAGTRVTECTITGAPVRELATVDRGLTLDMAPFQVTTLHVR